MRNVGVVGCGLMGAGIAEVVRPGRAGRRGRRVERRGRAGRAQAPGGLAAAGGGEGQDRLGRRRARPDPGRHRARGPRRPRPRDRGDRRGRGRQGRALPSPRRDRHLARRDPGLQHLLDPDHEAGRRSPAARSRSSASTSSTPCRCCQLVELVPSLLTADGDHRPRPLVRRGDAGQAGHRLPGPRRLRRQRTADPLRALRDPDARVGLRHRRRHRPRASCSAPPTRRAPSRWPT